MKAIERLAIETGVQNLIKSGKMTTSLAVENSIPTHPTQLILADEIGRRIFGKAGHKRASTYETAIVDTFLELWSSGPISIFRTTTRAHSEAAVIEAPAISMFGVSTHRDFYSSLGQGAIDNGLLNRLLIVEADKRGTIRNVDIQNARKPPEHVLEAVMALKPEFREGDMASGVQAYLASVGVQARTVPWADERAHERWQSFRNEMLDVSDQSEELAPFVSRAAEMVTRVATLWALSRFGKDAAMVTVEAVDWAVGLVRESVRNAKAGARDHIVASEFQEHVRRVEKIVRSKKRVPFSIVARKMNGVIDNVYLDRIIKSLEGAGIIRVDRGAKGTILHWA